MDHRLREDAVVTVSLPAGGRVYRVGDFDAVVVALTEAGVALEAVGVAREVLPARVDDVFVSFVYERRLVGLKGTLASGDGEAGLRFRVQDGVHVRRRGYTRVDADLPVTLRREGGADACRGRTVNVAPEGVLVSAALAVELGEVLELLLTLPGHERPWRLRGEVVRRGGGMIAVRFGRGERESRAAVAEFVVERRAVQLRRRGDSSPAPR
jgi:hypothetical protein